MRELSRLASLAESHTRLIEAGRGVGLDTAMQLADVFGVTLDWLAGRVDEPAPTPADVRVAVGMARKAAAQKALPKAAKSKTPLRVAARRRTRARTTEAAT